MTKKICTISAGICGAIASGKTTLAKETSKETGFELVNEETVGSWNYKIIAEIDSIKHPWCVFDHCYLYKKADLFSKSYDLTLMYLLLVEEEVLLKNFKDRLAVSKTGDFSKIDPVEHEKVILSEFKTSAERAELNVIMKILNVKKYSDYALAKKKILKDIKSFGL